MGRSGLDLPAISLGLWHNFGDDVPFERQQSILRAAFDLGVTHFDLANNYGPPYGAAEENFGRHLRGDFRDLRDELVISSKAGWDMWPGPYGQVGGSRKYLVASLDQSLQPDGPRLRRHLLPPPPGPLHAAGGDDGRAATRSSAPARRCTSGSRRTPRAHPRGRPDPRRPGHAAADPPAVVLHAQPLGRDRRPARHARPTSAPAASRSPRWHRGCSPTSTSTASPRGRAPARTSRCRRTCSPTRRSSHIRALNDDGPRPRPDAWRRWRWPGRCATRRSARCSSAPAPRSRSATTWPRWATWPSPTTSWSRIDEHARDSGIDLWASAREEGGRD